MLAVSVSFLFDGTVVASPNNPVPLANLAPDISQLVPPLPQKPSEDTEIQTIHTSYQTLNEACFKTGGTMNGVTCEPPLPPVTNSPESANTHVVTSQADIGPDEPPGVILVGQTGWSTPWGNCVDEPGVNNPGYGNPISWSVLYSTPHLGSTVLFFFNHTAVVVGIWSNGDIEVGQENSPGASHTYSPSQIRGYR